jgi:hypothetical protein
MTNLYSVTSNLEVTGNATSYISPGIHENIKMVNVEYDTTDKGNEYVAFYFEDERGDKLSHTEWPVKPTKPLDAMSDEEKKTFLALIDNQKRRVGQIVTCFVPKESYTFNADSFKQFAENIIKILGTSFKTKTVRVKIVYNNKNYTTLPNYWRYTFIEPMSVSTAESRIRLLNIDKIERTEPDIVSSPSAVPSVSTDDLPF